MYSIAFLLRSCIKALEQHVDGQQMRILKVTTFSSFLCAMRYGHVDHDADFFWLLNKKAQFNNSCLNFEQLEQWLATAQ